MKEKSGIIAYIDGANLHRGVVSLGWQLDYARFRVWLRDKYGVARAYLFIGYIPQNKDLYTHLQEAGFTLVFKDVVFDGDGKAKGNCDADLVAHAMQDFYERRTTAAVLVTSDGDYAPLVKFWQEKQHLAVILSPAPVEKCSLLLKRTGAKIVYLDFKKKLLRAQ